jgi:phage tail-like protein
MGLAYPHKKYRYSISIDGNQIGEFSDVYMPEADILPIDYSKGSFPANSVSKQPGMIKIGKLTIKRGLTADTHMSDWFKLVQNGESRDKLFRQISVSVMNEQGKEVAKYSFSNALPLIYTVPPLGAVQNGDAAEEIELAYESMTWEI